MQSHKWTATIRDVVKGTGCPYCSHRKVCKCNSLQTLRPDVAAEWCYAGNAGTPNDYTSRTHEEVWWESDRRGQWKESINSQYYSLAKPEVFTFCTLQLSFTIHSQDFADFVGIPAAHYVLQPRLAANSQAIVYFDIVHHVMHAVRCIVAMGIVNAWAGTCVSSFLCHAAKLSVATSPMLGERHAV